MAGQYGGQQVVIVDPSKEQKKGKDALSMNIIAAKAVSNIIKTTLGPKGMDKMLVNAVGDIVLTNDGAMILKGMDIEHPTAKMIVEIAKTQEDIAGDGTTSAVVISGALLEKAEDLIELGVHPTILVKGFLTAAEKAQEILDDFAIDVTGDNREILENVAKTAIAGKSAEAFAQHIAGICVDACLATLKDGKVNVKDEILLKQDPGGSIIDTELIEGVMINKSRLHSKMPKSVENAKIALLDTPIEVKKTLTKSSLQITSAEMLSDFLKQENADFKKIVDHIIETGANVVFCSKNIDEDATEYFQKAGIFAMRRVNEDEMKGLSFATGGHIIKNINDLTAKDLGSAGIVEQKGEFDLGKTYVKHCTARKTVSIILKGGTEHVTDNLERTVDDALHVVKGTIEDRKVVPGAGACEIEVALKLNSYASSIEGREQLAIAAFADSLESVPRAIAENAGMDGIDTVLDLRAKHSTMSAAGVDVYTGEICDMLEKGIVDPLRVKKQAIRSASEVANMILRVDNMLRARRQDMMDVKPEHNIHNYNGI